MRAGPRLAAGSFPTTSTSSAAVTAPMCSVTREVAVCGRSRARAPRVRQCRTSPPATRVVERYRYLDGEGSKGRAGHLTRPVRALPATVVTPFKSIVPFPVVCRTSSRSHQPRWQQPERHLECVRRHEGGPPVRWSTTWTPLRQYSVRNTAVQPPTHRVDEGWTQPCAVRDRSRVCR